MGSPLPPHSLIFEKFEKSTAVPDMAPARGCRPGNPVPGPGQLVQPQAAKKKRTPRVDDLGSSD